MNFSVEIINRKLTVFYNNAPMLENLYVVCNFPNNRERLLTYIPKSAVKEQNKFVVEFTRETPREWEPELKELYLTFTESNGTLTAKIDVACFKDGSFSNHVLDAFSTATVKFGLPKAAKGNMILHTLNPYWDMPEFAPLKQVEYPIDCVTANLGENHLNVLPVFSAGLCAEIRNDGIHIHTKTAPTTSLSGAFMSIAAAEDPLEANRKNLQGMKQNGLIISCLAEEKQYPKQLDGFGWCTWNAFYRDVNQEGIIKKLEEFKAKGIMPFWVLIDDGWSKATVNSDVSLLDDFKEDTSKFPSGLKSTIKAIKSYGVKYVGVWHAFTGYWSGINKESELYKNNKDMFFTASNGKIYPGASYESAYNFFNTWHEYLKAQGVDFIKVDNQASFCNKCDYLLSGSSGLFNLAKALDDAAFKNFGGALINCMGATFENIVARPKSLINRNSDDFFPDKQDDFAAHTIQNAYVATLQQNINNCDYDMFFTSHPSAVGSAVLRAISGGPVYVSDKVGESNADVILHLCDKNGKIYRFQNAAIPTYDCFYTDCAKENKLLKVFNICKENYVIGAFGVSKGNVTKGEIKLADIKADGEYLVHDYFADKYFVLNKNGKIDVTLNYEGYALYTLYPIKGNKVTLGDSNFYAEGATENTKTVDYKTLL